MKLQNQEALMLRTSSRWKRESQDNLVPSSVRRRPSFAPKTLTSCDHPFYTMRLHQSCTEHCNYKKSRHHFCANLLTLKRKLNDKEVPKHQDQTQSYRT
ncbi:hypothetical protein EUGRSUZ_E01338 [Eucalyptus grandis]|uniref:Uncharacterized protein n=2 Tax=Eucalyptus grandis TaxID=71139 RepID=A0ACC3KU06_EUCGR|nr:hypothetical protein EUGRSUZ_E01338 [Eucalyptus grandis]